MNRFTCSGSTGAKALEMEASSGERPESIDALPLRIATVANISLLHRRFRIDGYPGR
jgi:hypothetical protein